MKSLNIDSRRALLPALAASAILALGASPTFAANGKGLTFGVYAHDSNFGIDRVGIYGTGNPYQGDTLCKKKLPILCINVDGSPRPGYVPSGNAFYEGWVEGHLQATLPTQGPSSLAAADAKCVTAFGAGWRMAEFHDGRFIDNMNATNFCNSAGCTSPWPAGMSRGGHSMWGNGHLDPTKRYWTHINNQPGNCWN